MLTSGWSASKRLMLLWIVGTEYDQTWNLRSTVDGAARRAVAATGDIVASAATMASTNSARTTGRTPLFLCMDVPPPPRAAHRREMPEARRSPIHLLSRSPAVARPFSLIDST